MNEPKRTATRSGRRSVIWLCVAGVGWCVLLADGWARLYSYTYRPEATERAASDWPGGVSLGPSATGFRIVVFVHPLCPCTQATLQELDETLVRIPNDVSVVAVPVTCGLSPTDMASSRIIARLQRIPRVTIHPDPDGELRRRFGARVSGEVFAFAGDRCVYHGGLTPGRGHQGDFAGQRRLEGLAAATGRLRGRPTEACCEAPVFGCRLPGDDCSKTHPPPEAR